MNYQEAAPSDRLTGLVKVVWTMELDGDPESSIDREAAPDGCIELIHRRRGQSSWHFPQPEFFIGGLIEQAAHLRMSGDASFVGVRIWPWAWNSLFSPHSRQFVDNWVEMPESVDSTLASYSSESICQHIEDRLYGTEIAKMGALILSSSSAGYLARASGKSMRWLQRWFDRYIGVPPQRYFRMLRFQSVMDNFQHDGLNLAHHAAEHGFADQAHMARDFRAFVGTSAQKARRSAKGPFFNREVEP